MNLAATPPYKPSLYTKIMNNRDLLGIFLILPMAVLLVCLLAYPLLLGVWLGFTDANLGSSGSFIGFGNYEWLLEDEIFLLSVFNTTLYTVIASIFKFAIGLYLAILLNRHLPFQRFLRAIILLPWVTPTVLSAIAFWWIYDTQFSIISWSLVKLGWIDTFIDFLGEPNLARGSVIVANIWRGIPFVAISLLAGLQTVPKSLYEAATMDGSSPWQRFRFITFPLLTPIIAVVMTFSVLFTFTHYNGLRT